MKDLRERGRASVPSRAKPAREPPARGPAPRARAGSRTSSSCSGRPATWPIARSSRRSTSCGGRTCCPHEFVPPRGRPARRTTTTTFRAEIRTSLDAVQPGAAARRPDAWSVASSSGSPTTAATSATRPGSTRSRPRSSELDAEHGTRGNRLFYLATQPSQFAEIVGQLGRVGLDHEKHDGGWRRIVIEKPFGHDLESAKRLNREVGKVFRESQVYRIDHYLGKETVRNLLVFRFGNGIFEPLWNRRYVDHVQITVAESIGIENRGAFYEETGASRDVLQNHLLQLVSLIAMEPPATFEADALRDEKVKVLRAIASDPADVDRQRRPRSVRSGLGRGDPGPGLSPGTGGRPGIGDRDVRRGQVHDRRLALVRRARSTSGPASACPSARPRSRSSTARSRTGCSRTRTSTRTRTCSPSGSSPTRGSCCASGRRCRAWAWTSAR